MGIINIRAVLPTWGKGGDRKRPKGRAAIMCNQVNILWLKNPEKEVCQWLTESRGHVPQF
jgi:hypothetical protein